MGKDAFLVCSDDSVFKYWKKRKGGGGLENTKEKITQEVDGTLNQSHPGMPESYT